MMDDVSESPYSFMSVSDQVTWRYRWYWKFLHPRIYLRMRRAFRGIPALSDLLS